jgi:hypothetical protein
MALSVQESWAALVKAATAYKEKNKPKMSQDFFQPKTSGQSLPTPAVGDYLRLGLGREPGELLTGPSTNLKQRGYDSLPDNLKNSPVGKALLAEVGNASIQNDIAIAHKAYMDAQRNQAHMERGLIPSPAPQPSESRGQLRVDLDTSPVQTKDSVMYRNAGDGEESTIGGASRPNKRKPGLSSNLGINL